MKDITEVITFLEEYKQELSIEENMRCYNPVRVDKIEKLTASIDTLKKFIGFNVPVSGNEANPEIKQSGEVAVCVCKDKKLLGTEDWFNKCFECGLPIRAN